MSLLNTIKKTPEIRKIFGKREIEIIEKQILGINLTPSEKTRLSRDIKKKFEAIKALSLDVSEFNLKKGQRIKALTNSAVEVILKNKFSQRIKKIVLFGSTVENERTSHSDIDISVEFTEITKQEAVEFRIKVIGELNEILDIQVYNALPDKIKKQIDSKGKVLYERKY
jgi:predicted nucleotidyltransferase